MTAWLVVAIPLCVLVKCCIDFISLEYGSKFQIIPDSQILLGCFVLCAYAFLVDFVNFMRMK